MAIENLEIPKAAFEQHIIALGKTRSGKSSVMRLLVEHLLDEEKPVTIVDPKGDWWGIKASASGKRAGYPLVIFGGEHSDVPLNARSGVPVAELLATGNRSAVIDLGGWMPSDRTQFWIDFASSYFRVHKGRHWLVVDEVHNFCFKGKVLSPDAGKMLHWSNRLASEGLGKGISLLAASQRPQKVHNDFLTSCETLIAMRVLHKADRQAYRDWIDGCGDPDQGKELLATVAQMKRGEAWVWSPENDFGPKRIAFPLFKTYDSFKAQGPKEVKLKGWAEVNLDDVRDKLQAAVKEAQANDPKKLHVRIRQLEAELRSKRMVPPEVRQVADPRAVADAVKKVDEQRKRELAARDATLRKMSATLAGIAKQAASAAGITLPSEMRIELPKKQYPAPRQAATAPRTLQSRAESNGKLRAGAERMLAALAQWSPEGMTEGQMRAHAGMKKSGTFSTYMSDLRRVEYIEERGGMVYASQAGLEYCQHVPAAPSSTAEVVEVWKPKLRDGARRMLDVLVELGGEGISKEELGERAGLSKSGTFSAYLSDLRTARLVVVDRDGIVAANKENLFL